jgi:hypothetical protein
MFIILTGLMPYKQQAEVNRHLAEWIQHGVESQCLEAGGHLIRVVLGEDEVAVKSAELAFGLLLNKAKTAVCPLCWDEHKHSCDHVVYDGFQDAAWRATL